jgi:hypothetical protein
MTLKMFLAAVGVALAFALVLLVPTAGASQANQATRVTFNQAVQIPGGMVLPAGTYWFQLPDDALATASTNVVEIFDANRAHIVTTLETVPTLRKTLTGHTEFTFAEQSRNRPIALLDWFYPGRLTGHKFVYAPRIENQLAENEQITLLAHTAPAA